MSGIHSFISLHMDIHFKQNVASLHKDKGVDQIYICTCVQCSPHIIKYHSALKQLNDFNHRKDERIQHANKHSNFIEYVSL